MIGSTIPGMTVDVMRADHAARLRDAGGGRLAAETARGLRAARREARRARRSARISVPRRPAWPVGQRPYDSPA